MLKDNLRVIEQNIERAAAKTGRKREDITLIGVTKTIDPTRIVELGLLGVTDFGENRVQELLEKYPMVDASLKTKANWHLIGHLQRNKVKYIIDKVCLIHSVDSYRLAEEIDRRAGELNLAKNILVEVNVGGEESKQGVSFEEAPEFLQELAVFKHLRVQGMMTVAPFVENPEENRFLFRKMFKLFIDMKENFNNNSSMKFLSMGMTNDYVVAIEEGANMVRIGTGIFGPR